MHATIHQIATSRLNQRNKPNTHKFLALLESRYQQGLETYGTPLEAYNGRNAINDLLEELADAYLYAIQAQVEGRLDAKFAKNLEQLTYDLLEARDV